MLNQVVIKAKGSGAMAGVVVVQKIDVEALAKSMTFEYTSVFRLIAALAKGGIRLDRLDGPEHYGDILIVGYPPSNQFHFPTFLVNGIEFSPNDGPERYLEVRNIDVGSIKHLEIGEKITDGLNRKYIIINTYKNGYSRKYPAGMNTFKVAGFSRVKEFYSAQYNPGSAPKATDERSTIYWNPTIKTDNNGIGKLVFYNSDKAASFSLEVEGASPNGDVGALRTTINNRIK
jgi:hypothetical protein